MQRALRGIQFTNWNPHIPRRLAVAAAAPPLELSSVDRIAFHSRANGNYHSTTIIASCDGWYCRAQSPLHLPAVKATASNLCYCDSSGSRPSSYGHKNYSRAYSTKIAEEDDDEFGFEDEPTIYALSTPPGTSAIAVIRISGPQCLSIYHKLTKNAKPPRPRYAGLRRLHHPESGAILDPGSLVLFFPGPNSHTGSDILELHIHGGPAIIRSVLSAIPLCAPSSAHRIQYAEPGEFSRRAFTNERLSLPEIEALGHLLAAQTEQQRRIAVSGTSAVLTNIYESWRQTLLSARGELEALIDFSEDQSFEQTPAELISNVAATVRTLQQTLTIHTTNALRGELLRSGIRLALVGAPNAGKSSLLNALVRRDAAIVSSTPGTTRDVVESLTDIAGFPVLLADTAGLRAAGAAGDIENEGMRRARLRARDAHVIVAVVDVTQPIPSEVEKLLQETHQHVVLVANKTDLPHDIQVLHTRFPNVTVYPVSCVQNTGLQDLLTGLASIFRELTKPTGPGIETESLAATERQCVLVQECMQHLDEFMKMMGVTKEEDEEEVDIVVVAEVLRAAAVCIARITGRGEGGDVEEVLGVVFERFCVGK